MQKSYAPGAASERAPWTDRYVIDEKSDGDAPPMIDMAEVRGFLWRQRVILLGVTAIALAIGFITTLLTTPTYEATSAVRVDPEARANIFQGDEVAQAINLNNLGSYISTLGKVVESRSMAFQVVDALKLTNNPEFMTAETRPAGISDQQWQINRRNAAAARLMANVSAESPPAERLVLISYRSSNPALAAKVANSYADNFLTDDLRRSIQQNAYAREYLADQIAALRRQLDEAQRKALGYARANNIIGDALIPSVDSSSGQTAPQTITAMNLGAINSSVAEARARRIAAEQRWRTAEGADFRSLPEFQQNVAAQSLLSDRGKVVAALTEARTRYGPDHPEVKELLAQQNSIDRQVSQSGAGIKAGLRNAFEVALRQEDALTRELNRVSGQTLDEQDSRVVFNQLNSNATALQTQLASLLDRYNQISASANVQPSTITLLDYAIQPETPISPSLMKNLLIALLVGGGAALGLAVVREMLDDRLRSGHDVERKLGLPLLGITPLVDDEDPSISKMLVEAYSSIRAAVGFRLPHLEHNVIQLTSSQSGEGKSTTAMAIAREYARLNKKVLLIDADLRRPSIAALFGAARMERGFAEVLAGEIEFADALLDQPLQSLDVLPVGALPANPVEVLSSQQFAGFIAKYRELYDLVIIDSPPVIGLADGPLIAQAVDGTIFVVESNRAHFGQAKASLRRMRDSGANLIGVVLTKFQAREAGQPYDYQYSYYTYGDKQGT